MYLAESSHCKQTLIEAKKMWMYLYGCLYKQIVSIELLFNLFCPLCSWLL